MIQTLSNSLLALAAIGLLAGCGTAAVSVDVRSNDVIKDVRSHPLGTTTPLLVADPAQTTSAIKQLGTAYLRYGDQRYSFWSEPPFEKASPVTIQRGKRAWPAKERELVQPDGVHFRAERVTDFDEFLSLARESHSRPVIITAYNGVDGVHQRGVVIPPKEDFFRAAVEQVRYANVVKKTGIVYWELGNELWNPKEGGVQDPLQVADDLQVLVPRMKAVDPSIKVLVSGNNFEWFRDVLSAAPQIDDLCFSWYLPSDIESYNDFRTAGPLLDRCTELRAAETALDQLDHFQYDRIGIIVTEFNAINWENRWPNTNDLGHALCVFQQAGEALSHPRIDLAIHWTTQWADPRWSTQSDDASVYNSVRRDGRLAANGRAVSIWGQNLLAEFVAARSSRDFVSTWATRSDDRRSLNVFLLNKDYTPHPLKLALDDPAWRLIEAFRFSGKDISDLNPTWLPADIAGPMVLPPTSVTLLKFDRGTAKIAR